MFCVFNKQKIYSYLIAASAAVVLFVLSFYLRETDMKAVETASNLNSYTSIYNNEKDSKKISIIVNNNCDKTQVEQMLGMIEKSKIDVTFFVIEEWKNKYPEYVKKIEEKGYQVYEINSNGIQILKNE